MIRHGVPHEPNPLLGRDDDIAEVERLLRASRAVTVVGPGGLGKTRLAHAVSRGPSSAWCISCRSPVSPPTRTWPPRSPPRSVRARSGPAP